LNCNCAPAETVALVGETTSETGTGALTVRKLDPVTEPAFADTVVVPASMPSASPAEFTAATAGLEDVQVADCVMSWVDPSLYVAMAVNCSAAPEVIDTEEGVTAIEDTVAWPTVIVVEEERDAEVAVMAAIPCPELVAKP
jgi:hypothetical protein